MESNGAAGRIHCSEAVMLQLQSTGMYVFSPRGPIDVKGKGVMRTYWLEGPVDEKHPRIGRDALRVLSEEVRGLLQNSPSTVRYDALLAFESISDDERIEVKLGENVVILNEEVKEQKQISYE
jgi:hypothetical protein